MIIPCIEAKAKTDNMPAKVVHLFFDDNMNVVEQCVGVFDSTLRDNNMDAYIAGKALSCYHAVDFINSAI